MLNPASARQERQNARGLIVVESVLVERIACGKEGTFPVCEKREIDERSRARNNIMCMWPS